MAQRRIAQELADLQRNPPEMFSAAPVDDNDTRHWVASIVGPTNTPYAQTVFSVAINFPETYPHNAFRLAFTTPIFHPNVSTEGEIRLAELESDQWSPAFTVKSVLISFQAMLSDPNRLESCVLNSEAATLYSTDHEAFKERVRLW